MTGARTLPGAVEDFAAHLGEHYGSPPAPWVCAPADLAPRSRALAAFGRRLEDAPVGLVVTGAPPGERGAVRARLEAAGLEVLFHGLTPRDGARRGDRAVLSVVRTPRPRPAPPPGFRVVALVGAYNEEGVIVPFLEHTLSQGVDVLLLDNWSTDRTAERAARFLGRGLTRIVRFPDGGPSPTHDWHAMLQRKAELAAAIDADWFVHLDPDEIRESPWPGVRLREALHRVDREGFNAVDHTCLVFHPTGGGYRDDRPLQPQFTHCEFGTRPAHFRQVKAWKRQPAPVDCASSGGHQARFPGRRVYPFKFLLRHYPILSQEHGERKVFRDRLPRFSPALRQIGWHKQYDGLGPGHRFVRDPAALLAFDPATFYEDYLVERLSGAGIARQRRALRAVRGARPRPGGQLADPRHARLPRAARRRARCAAREATPGSGPAQPWLFLLNSSSCGSTIAV